MKLPDPLTRRHWLEGETSAARCIEVAEAYRAEGRDAEAIAFLEKAEASEALEALIAKGIADGDGFLAQSASRSLGRELSKDEWKALGRAAEAAGRQRYHELAERQAGT